MNEVEIKVVATELKSLADKVETGFESLKELIKSNNINLNDHVKEDKETHSELEDQIHQIKMDLAVFKTRWTVMVGLGGVAVELLMHLLK